ncbi:bL32 family ribosomal protein [Actinomarinicola tropica]|uniref:Uncharacterized protein n=1 Tax=Actinomarinicola tropica TaxID=2789776 RepID=A0A5Q2RJ66_9ACTN|nr:hypothetical protein [Actinomarinicola tropica]QGG94611.1 hypothetical protein GH723_05530 [Actinomarinicola tropica]
MSVMRCPSCGELSLSRSDVCPGCGASMEAFERDAGRGADDAPVRPDVAQERRELHEWTMEGRRLLDGMLQRSGIPRTWQGSTLITPDVEHDRVEEMVELVGVGDAQVGAEEDVAPTDAPDAGDTADEVGVEEQGVDQNAEDVGEGEVGYDLSGWTDLARGDLVAALAEAGIEHGWDEDGDLVVDAADERRVDAVFDRLTTEGVGELGAGAAGELEEDLEDDDALLDDDGLLVQETLSDLFVGADRLLHNPVDGTAATLVIDAQAQLRALRLPFGFERTQWRMILGAAEELAESFVPSGMDEDAVRDRAARLRGLLRDVV